MPILAAMSLMTARAAHHSLSFGVAVLVALLLVTALAVPTSAADSGEEAFEPAGSRPDIVVFVLDDIPRLDGRVLSRLPNVKKIFLDKGLDFSDFHVETPTCCPGRAGFLTGLHTHQHRTIKTDGRLFKPGETIATALRRKGYRTIQVGKYLNLFDLIPDKTPPGWVDFHGFGGRYFDYDMWSNGARRHYGSKPRHYSTDVIADLSVKAVTAAPRRKRIFAWITPYTFHKPYTVAPRHRGSKTCSGVRPWKPPGYMEADVSDKPSHIRRLRRRTLGGYDLQATCAGLLSFDQLVGRVTDRLKRQGRFENTLLILTSDNGMNFGSHRVYGDKKTPYSTQVPFYVRWPKLQGSTPSTIDERLQNIDLAPTLCTIAGCSLGPYPTGQKKPAGKSFLDLMTGERSQLQRTSVLSSYRAPGKWVPRWWSVTTTASSAMSERGCAVAEEGGCRWIWVEYETGARELYDISNGPCWEWDASMSGDPCMLENLAGKSRYALIQRDLKQRLRKLH